MRRIVFADVREVGRWTAVAVAVAVILLTLTLLFAAVDHGNAISGQGSELLAPTHDFSDLLWVFKRNLLVLGIHVCACWIGAIIGRPHQPVPQGWGRVAGTLGRPVPAWLAKAALYYALIVTLASVGAQSVGLGRELADIAAAAQISRLRLLWIVLPHAAPELVAVFLPLGLFLLEARRGRLDRLGLWSLQAAGIAIPVLLCAAAIETFVTPPRVIAARGHAVAAAVHTADGRAVSPLR